MFKPRTGLVIRLSVLMARYGGLAGMAVGTTYALYAMANDGVGLRNLRWLVNVVLAVVGTPLVLRAMEGVKDAAVAVGFSVACTFMFSLLLADSFVCLIAGATVSPAEILSTSAILCGIAIWHARISRRVTSD